MALPRERNYTYQDWLDMDENIRAELIDGRIFVMAAPSRRHQAVSREISRQLSNHLLGKQCKTYSAPFAVRLEDDVVVEPDIVVICDPRKLTDAGCNGAPDLIIEILSPSSTSHDKYTKFMLYLRNRVPEYWIVDPENNAITVHRLTEDGYVTTILTHTDTATINAVPELKMDLSAVFAEE